MSKVAISADFLTAFSRLPQAQQKKVREFTEKFRLNPTAASIHYEPIHGTRDDKVRTVRIGLDYRAVVIAPPKGDVFLLVWVDHHDEAMAWARHKSFEVHPETGAIQVYEVVSQPAAAPPAPEPTARKAPPAAPIPLFQDFTDAALLQIGVPAPLLPDIRAITSDGALEQAQSRLPAEAYEGLYMLAAGYTLPETLEELLHREVVEPVDPQDFEKAIEHLDSRRRFVVVESARELVDILNAPLVRWRIFLHPSQEKLVRQNFNGPAMVLGGAGTGKTVVAMHRARHLAVRVFAAPTDRILFTTYTRNLAANIRQNLKELCGDEIKRIEVVNLHQWASQFMRSQGFSFETASEQELQDCWQEALAAVDTGSLDRNLLRKEWLNVVQAQGITDEQGYLKAPRLGMGTRLSRPQKVKTWEVFEEYREALASRRKMEWLDLIRETKSYLEQKPGILPYRAVVVDETQDLHPEELRLIRALVPAGANDIFLVGDAHQRIYGRKVVLSQCGIHVRGRSRRLRINYRTTEEIRNWSVAVISGKPVDDLDGGPDSQKGYKSLLHGAKPEVLQFKSLAQERDFLVKTLQALCREHAAETICLSARTHALLDNDYIPMLEGANIPFVKLDNRDADDGVGIRLATMHRIKGLEFPHILIVGVNEGIIPNRHLLQDEDDPVAREEQEMRERCLLYVAATRARDTLLVTSYGKPSPFLQGLLSLV